jgi:small-conductance mechanosensitive channel
MSHRPSRFRSDLNFAIEEKFREAGIEIPFPQRDLHIRSGSVGA